MQLLEYWRDPARKPVPSKRELADRSGVTEKAIQLNMKALEDAGLIRRELRRTAAGDWDSNVYHLDGLISQVKKMEPEFAKEREMRTAIREARRNSQALPSRRAKRKAP